MAFWNRKKPDIEELASRLVERLNRQEAMNADATLRNRIASLMSGTNYVGDTLHDIARDYGYPETLEFAHYWNMYRRFGVARNVVELPADTGWMTTPTIEGPEAFRRDIERLVSQFNLWIRLKGLDTRQRVGRYAGLLMRVRDNLPLDRPIEGKLNGLGSLVDMIPLYESQLKVVETDTDPQSETYGRPKIYQYSETAPGGRNPNAANTVSIHASRVIIAAEGADNGWIYGISSLEAPFNSLMDLRKIIGAGGEGFYKNAAQSIVFQLKDAASAGTNKDLLTAFNEKYDEFAMNRSRRAMWTPGLEAKVLESSLANPKEFFMNALNDVSAASKIPATILIGQQTGRLASAEDSRNFLATINGRRQNFMTEMISNVLDWCMVYGVLPAAEYQVEWDDLLALSDDEKLNNANRMSEINRAQFQSGGDIPFSGEEIREAAGYEPEDLETPSEDLDGPEE